MPDPVDQIIQQGRFERVALPGAGNVDRLLWLTRYFLILLESRQPDQDREPEGVGKLTEVLPLWTPEQVQIAREIGCSVDHWG